MTWWVTVLQYGSGPVVAAGAVLWQQGRADRREDTRRAEDRAERARDREHELHRLETEQIGALEERWRDERLEAHASLLASLRRAVNALATMEAKAIPGVHVNPEYAQATDQADADVEAARTQEATVALLGSAASSAAAREALLQLLRVHLRHRMFTLDEERRGDLIHERRALHEVIDLYQTAARAELGTERV